MEKQLNVNYLGLNLKNPVIVSSSGLTASLERIKALEAAGASAVVLKSLFEEQIMHESAAINYCDYPEANDYLAEYTRQHRLEQHVQLIADTKKACLIPVIASICCVTRGEWVGFAKRLEEAGADALELNIFLLPTDKRPSGEELENRYLAIVAEVVESVSIPVTVKLGRQFTNLLNITAGIAFRGAKGVVMFNRFYEPDIDINAMKLVSSSVYSSPGELRSVLRWVALASAQDIGIDFAASTGIHDGEAVVKALLAGASAVEICSTIYEHGNGIVQKMLADVEAWMETYGYPRLSDAIGVLNYKNIDNPVTYERSQFMKYFVQHA
ncbi:MAG: dihydroorotate dehydrogenase-like protein [Rikenellaceae bacterium]|jgi:dihydroorotate dehydrogenase (fumarate)|nr:dihydroorotate dehydrogenase-like protein [Rikenellaceae bacterium]